MCCVGWYFISMVSLCTTEWTGLERDLSVHQYFFSDKKGFLCTLPCFNSAIYISLCLT